MKKLSSLLLVLSLLLGLLSGCGGQTNTAASEVASVPKASEAPSSEAPAPTAAPAAQDSVREASELAAPAYTPVDYSLPLFEDTTEISLFYVLRGGHGRRLYPRQGF